MSFFFIRQLSPLTSCKCGVKRDSREIHAFQINDLIAYRLEHTLDLMEFSFCYRDFAGTIGEEIQLCGLCGAFFADIDTAAKQIAILFCQRTFAFKTVCFFHMAFRRKQCVGERAVVG